MKELIRIRDHGTVLPITFEDCVRYNGRTAVGGVALGFRLLQRTFAHLGVFLPEREKVTFRTAFPGYGVRDTIEMVTRAVTRDAYHFEEDLGPQDAPAAPAGRFYFEIGYDEQTVRLVTRAEAVPEEFLKVGRTFRKGDCTEEVAGRWTELKEILSATIMSVEAEDVLEILE